MNARAATPVLLILLAAALVTARPGGDPQLAVPSIAAAIAAVAGAFEVRRDDVLGWTIAIGTATCVVGTVVVAHTVGLPGYSRDSVGIQDGVIGLLSASVLSAGVCRRCVVRPRLRRADAPHPARRP